MLFAESSKQLDVAHLEIDLEQAPAHQIGFAANLVAAVVLGQLEQLEQKVKNRREVFAGYLEQFSRIDGVTSQVEPEGSMANRWLSTFHFGNDTGPVASTLMDKLATENIESRPLWKPLHTQGAFGPNALYFGGDCAESLFENGVCLPSLFEVSNIASGYAT
jgi:pyridoxal phosphate-dependent aminotransferase EpsN